MQGMVMKSTGSWYDVLTADEKIVKCRVRGKFKLDDLKVTNPLAVGDQVNIEFEVDGTAVIDKIFDRENYFIRRSVHKTSHGHIIAANIDQSILIATIFYPRTSTGFIDRFLVSCEAFRIPAIIVFNKQDILTEEHKIFQDKLVAAYEAIGYRCILTSASDNKGIDELTATLEGKKSLFSGHSGVGKSTIINMIAPGISQKTDEISDFASKGKHTTTFAEMFKIGESTFIIDTPGIKELGLIEIGQDELSHYFPEMRTLLGKCKFYNCTHTHERDCAIIEAVKKGNIAEGRYYNYLSMFEDNDNRR